MGTKIKPNKLSSIEKEKKLLEKIEKAKKKLGQLRKQRIQECGELVVKHGLHEVDDKRLSKAFEHLAKELCHGNA